MWVIANGLCVCPARLSIFYQVADKLYHQFFFAGVTLGREQGYGSKGIVVYFYFAAFFKPVLVFF